MSDISFASEVYTSEQDKELLPHTDVEHIFKTKDGKYVAMAMRGQEMGMRARSFIADTIEEVQAAMQTLLETGKWPDGRELPE